MKQEMNLIAIITMKIKVNKRILSKIKTIKVQKLMG